MPTKIHLPPSQRNGTSPAYHPAINQHKRNNHNTPSILLKTMDLFWYPTQYTFLHLRRQIINFLPTGGKKWSFKQNEDVSTLSKLHCESRKQQRVAQRRFSRDEALRTRRVSLRLPYGLMNRLVVRPFSWLLYFGVSWTVYTLIVRDYVWSKLLERRAWQ